MNQSYERLVFAQDFVGANKHPKIEVRKPLPGTYNYFIGNDSSQWHTDVKGYSEVVYREVWRGIDLRVYGNENDIEQEFIVRPGGDLSNVRVSYRGIEGLRIADNGSLIIKTAFGEMQESVPRIYHMIDGQLCYYTV